jgi:hypothetical protein
MKISLILCMILLVVAMAGASSATVINFNELDIYPEGSDSTGMESYTFENYTIEDSSGGFSSFYSPQGLNMFYFGSAGLLNYSEFLNGVTGVSRLSTVDGSNFTLSSIDLASMDFMGNGVPPVDFYAYDSYGARVGSSHNSITVFGEWTSVLFDDTFSNVSYVEWEQLPWYHQFDNIILHPIPEPATMLLLCSGFIGLVGFRRKNKK